MVSVGVGRPDPTSWLSTSRASAESSTLRPGQPVISFPIGTGPGLTCFPDTWRNPMFLSTHRSNSERPVRRLTLEALEQREVPAGLVSAGVFGGILAVTGLNDANLAAASLGTNNQVIAVNGTGAGGFDVFVLNGTTFTGTGLARLHFTGVSAIQLDMGLGNDTVVVTNAIGVSRVVVFAGAGDDFIQVSSGPAV